MDASTPVYNICDPNDWIRVRSIIFKNIPELGSSDEAENRREDFTTVSDIIRWLGVEDGFTEDDVRRLPTHGYRHRHIMVTLNLLLSKKRVLDRKKWLAREPRLREVYIENAWSQTQVEQRSSNTRHARN